MVHYKTRVLFISLILHFNRNIIHVNSYEFLTSKQIQKHKKNYKTLFGKRVKS